MGRLILVEATNGKVVVTSYLPSPNSIVASLQERNENSCFLFSHSCRKSTQLHGTLFFPVVLSLPHFSRVDSGHNMEARNHEEVDTRMLLYIQDALDNGATTCLVHTVDTDVVIILGGKLYVLLERHPAADILVAFGTGNNFKQIHINAVCNYLGKEKSTALPTFHSFSGCDTTSSFL